jgi:FAD:protein FMN transferase
MRKLGNFIMLILRKLIVLLAVASILSACDTSPKVQKISGFAQGTTYNVSYIPTDSTPDQKALTDEITQELDKIDVVFSNYRADSVIEKFNENKTDYPQKVDAELIALIEKARSVYQASNGCYDLTVKPLFDLWGFKRDVFSPPTDDALAVTMSTIGMNYLYKVDDYQLRKAFPQLRVDVSSIGQGYTVGRIADLLESYKVDNYLVEIGGELKTKGSKPNNEPWKIALEKPLPNERKIHKIVTFTSGKPLSLMTSGTYRHYFDSEGKRYSHILDARTGKPVEHDTVSVALLHQDPSLADAWSTALLCLGSQEGLKIANQQNLAVLFIDQKNNQLIETPSDAFTQLKDVQISDAKE